MRKTMFVIAVACCLLAAVASNANSAEHYFDKPGIYARIEATGATDIDWMLLRDFHAITRQQPERQSATITRELDGGVSTALRDAVRDGREFPSMEIVTMVADNTGNVSMRLAITLMNVRLVDSRLDLDPGDLEHPRETYTIQFDAITIGVATSR